MLQPKTVPTWTCVLLRIAWLGSRFAARAPSGSRSIVTWPVAQQSIAESGNVEYASFDRRKPESWRRSPRPGSEAVVDQPAADLLTNQFSACAVPGGALRAVDLRDTGWRLRSEPQRDGLPGLVEEPVPIRDPNLEAVSSTAATRVAVAPRCTDEILASLMSDPGRAASRTARNRTRGTKNRPTILRLVPGSRSSASFHPPIPVLRSGNTAIY